MTSTVVNITPELLAAVMQLREFSENYHISFELKGYRPARKVITKKLVKGASRTYRIKRRLLVR